MIVTANIIALLAHLVTAIWILRRFRAYTVLCGYFMFLQTWSLVSCFYNDLGIYNFELFSYTETTLATSRLALFYIVFNLGVFLAATYLAPRPLARRDYSSGIRDLRLGNLKLLAYFFGLVLIGYIVYSFAVDGIPILEGIQRMVFLRSAGPIQQFMLSYGAYLAFTLGYFRRLRGRISVNGLLLLLMLLDLVLTGHKFSSLIRLLVAYYAAVYARHWTENQPVNIWRPRYLVIGGAVVVILLAGALASYSSIAGVQEPGRLLFERVFALQGHLWWATDHNVMALDRFDADHWQAEWQAIAHAGDVPEGSVGMKYVMISAVGPDKAFPIFDTGYMYTMAYPAILVLTFSYPVALLVQFMAGLLFGVLLYYLHYCLMYRHFIRALLTMNITLRYIAAVLCTGDVYVFLSLDMAFKLVLLLILELGVLRFVSAPGTTDRSEPATDVSSGVTG